MVEIKAAAEDRQRGTLTGAERWRRVGGWLIGLVAIFGLGLTLSARYFGEPPPSLELDVEGRLVVLPFETDGARGQAWQSWGLAAVATEGLGANDGIEVVPLQRLYSVLAERELALSPGDRPRLRQLAAALGAESVIDVRMRRVGELSRLEVEIYRSGQPGGSQTFEADTPLDAVSLLVAALADRVLGSVAKVPLEQVMPNDPFVRRLYAEGVDRSLNDGAEAAKAYFEIALRQSPSFALAKLHLIEAQRLTGELQTARELADDLLQQAQSRGQRTLLARAYKALGLVSAVAGQTAMAQEQYRQAYSLDVERQAPLEQAEALAAQARLALAGGQPDRAQELFVEVLDIREKNGDRLGEIDTLVRLGGLLMADQQLAAASNVLEQAAEGAKELKDVWEERRVAASLGEVAWRLGDAPAAVEYWQQALQFYEQRDDAPRKLLLSRNLARARAAMGNLSEAEDRSHQQMELARKLQNPSLEADAALRLTLLQLRQGYPSQARRHLDRALELDRYLEDRSELQRAIAWLAFEQGNYKLAVDTQRRLARHEEEGLSDYDAAFLSVFIEAREKGRRLPLPHEPGYRSPLARPG